MGSQEAEVNHDEGMRFDFQPVRNEAPVLTFECGVGRPLPHSCRGKTYWDGVCQCACHRPATCERSKVR